MLCWCWTLKVYISLYSIILCEAYAFMYTYVKKSKSIQHYPLYTLHTHTHTSIFSESVKKRKCFQNGMVIFILLYKKLNFFFRCRGDILLCSWGWKAIRFNVFFFLLSLIDNISFTIINWDGLSVCWNETKF